MPAPATPSFTAYQRYGGAAPAGIDSAALAARAGGLGERAKIIDVEYAWNTAHEDLAKAALPGALIANGVPDDPFPRPRPRHGGARELVATANAFGVTGLAQGSEIGHGQRDDPAGLGRARRGYDRPSAPRPRATSC